MHSVKDIVISDEVVEAVYDAIDLFGVYAFDIDVKAKNVIYVLGVSADSLTKMIEAQDYLNKRCPEFIWVAALLDWDIIVNNVEPLYISSVWYWED